MDTDSFVLIMNTQHIMEDIKIRDNLFDFSNWNQNHEKN